MAKKETKKKQKKMKGKAGANAASGKPQSSAPGANDAAAGANVNNMTLDRSQMTADQMTQAQIEEAIKESQDPSSRLKKLRSPFSVRSCLLNLLILVVLTVGIVLLCCYFMLDKETFNLWVVIKDMLGKVPTEKHSVLWFFKTIGSKIKGIFS